VTVSFEWTLFHADVWFVCLPIIQTRNNLVPNFSLSVTCSFFKFTLQIFLFDQHVLTFNNEGNQCTKFDICDSSSRLMVLL